MIDYHFFYQCEIVMPRENEHYLGLGQLHIIGMICSLIMDQIGFLC